MVVELETISKSQYDNHIRVEKFSKLQDDLGDGIGNAFADDLNLDEMDYKELTIFIILILLIMCGVIFIGYIAHFLLQFIQ